MPSRSRVDQSRSEATATPENAPAYQHPTDQSWNLQILLDLKEAIGRLDERLNERTVAFRETTAALRDDIKSLPTNASYWTGIGLVVVIIIGLGAAYWLAIDERLNNIAGQVQALVPRH